MDILHENITRPNTTVADDGDNEPPIPPGKSIAHHYIKAHQVVYCSLDIETGGEYCGIIQLSAELFRHNTADPTGSDFIPVPETFNQYIQPPETAIWNEQACRNSHGLTANSEVIKSARPFAFVWGKFSDFISRDVNTSEKVVLIAYNGETCDLKWIWRYLQAPRTGLSFPSCIKFFLDPLKTINHYKSCALHPSRSKLESLELGCVWKFITGQNLNGAHDSLIDAKAQTDITISARHWLICFFLHFQLPYLNTLPSAPIYMHLKIGLFQRLVWTEKAM
jgi:hypothetical protein